MPTLSRETQGILWTISACINFPILTAIVRHLTDLGMESPQIVFIRNLTALTILIPFIFLRKEKLDLKIRNRSLYSLRILFGLASMTLWFYGLGRLPLATATALSFSTPLFVAIGAVVLLREKMGIRRATALIFGFIGTLIILRPGIVDFNLAAVAVLGGCFFMSFALIIVKKLTSTETPFNMMFHMHLWMAVFSIPLGIIYWHDMTQEMLIWCYALAVFSIAGQYSVARSYTMVDVTLTLPFDFTRLIIASIIAYFFFHEVPDFWAYVGASLIIGSAIFIAHREAKLRKKQRKQVIIEKV